MNKLFIIGNGFDLAHGFDTRYSDFLLWYLMKCVKSAGRERKYEDKIIKITSPLILNDFFVKSVNEMISYMKEYTIRIVKYESQFVEDIINNK